MQQVVVKQYIVGGGSIGLLWASWIRQKYPKYPICVLLRDQKKHGEDEGNNVSSKNLNVILRRSHSILNKIWQQQQQQLQWQQHTVPVECGNHQQPETEAQNRSSPAGICGSKHDRLYGIDNTKDSCIANEDKVEGRIVSKISGREESGKQVDDVHVSIPYELINNNPTNGRNNPNNSSPIETLIVATKSYQAKDAVKSLLHRFVAAPTTGGTTGKQLRIIILCNGAFAVRDDLKQLFIEIIEESPMQMPLIYVATTTHGAYRIVEDKKSVVVHAGYGETFLEENLKDDDSTTINALQELWDDCNLNCATALSSNEMNQKLWYKLAVNCIINPLSVINNCCVNGEVINTPNFPNILQSALSEIATVYYYSTKSTNAGTYAGSTTAGIEQEIGEQIQGEENHAAKIQQIKTSMEQFVTTVLKQTSNNYSSMVQDVKSISSLPKFVDSDLDHKRLPKTEIQYLNGYIVRKGRQYNIPCPINQYLLTTILQIEQSRQQLK